MFTPALARVTEKGDALLWAVGGSESSLMLHHLGLQNRKGCQIIYAVLFLHCHCEWFRMEFELLAWGTSTSWCVTPVSGSRRQPLLLPQREEHTRPASCETSLTNLIFRLLLDMKTKAFRILALVLLFCLFKKFWANVTRWGSRWNRIGYVYMRTPAFSDPTINIASEKSS